MWSLALTILSDRCIESYPPSFPMVWWSDANMFLLAVISLNQTLRLEADKWSEVDVKVVLGDRAPPHPVLVWVSLLASQSFGQVCERAVQQVSWSLLSWKWILLNCLFLGNHDGSFNVTTIRLLRSTRVSIRTLCRLRHSCSNQNVKIYTGYDPVLVSHDASACSFQPTPPVEESGGKSFSSEVNVLKLLLCHFPGAHIQEPHWWVTEAVSTVTAALSRLHLTNTPNPH